MARFSTVSLFLTLFMLGLLTNQGFCRPNKEDYADYANDDYDGDDGEDDEEQFTGPPPSMISTPLHLEVHPGDTVALPCLATDLDQVLKLFVSLWKKESKLLFTEAQRGSAVDSRIAYYRANNSLVIHNIKKEDMGTYSCVISYTPPLELKHTINVFSPAEVKSILPLGSYHELKKGSSLTLSCNVTGYPVPKVKWYKKNKHDTEGTEISSTDSNITFNSLDRRDSGTYECVAENNQGPKASAKLQVRVIYSPEVVVDEELVATGEDYDANLKCNIHAEPKAEVQWLKDNQVITPTERYHFSKDGHIHIFTIKKVQKEDFDKYVCRANNSLGVVLSKPIEVTGKPDTPRLIEHSQDKDGKTLTVEYHIVSYSPIIEYKLLYRPVAEKEPWQTMKTPVVGAEDSNLFKLKHTLENLSPGNYLVSLRARNSNGWSNQAKSQPFSIMEDKENHEATAETSKMEEATEGASDASSRARIMSILTIISLSCFFL